MLLYGLILTYTGEPGWWPLIQNMKMYSFKYSRNGRSDKMKRIFFIFSILNGVVFTSFAQNVTLSGYIENKTTGERLVNATIVETKSGRGITCNRYGFFSLSLPRGENHLSVSHVGFTRVESTINLKTDYHLLVSRKLPGRSVGCGEKECFFICRGKTFLIFG